MPEVVETDYVEGPTPSGPRRSNRDLVLRLVLVVAVVAAVTGIVITRSGDDAGVSTAEVPVPVTRPPQAPRVELQVAPGWQTLLVDGDHIVVGTHPLTDRDLLLAVLARDDAVFDDFPAGGAVLVVGGDRFVAKYIGYGPSPTVVSTPDGEEVVLPSEPPAPIGGPGPALGLGPSTALAGGVTVRRGDVPQSNSTLAAYLGPDAPATAIQDAETMAASVRLIPFDFSTLPPPPGSRPGFDAGGVDLAPGQGRVVVSADGAGATYTVEADADCAIVVSPSFPDSALGGGCVAILAGGAAAALVAVAVDRGPPAGPPAPPVPGGAFVEPTLSVDEEQALLVLARVSPDTDELTAVLVDGRVVEGAVGDDGWALAVTDGRPYLLEARDRKGRVTGVTQVG